jgi:membrane protein insertase Oxa1/YidC/SpoIIIJ
MKDFPTSLDEAIRAYADRAKTIGLCAGYSFGSVITATFAMAVLTWVPGYWWSIMLLFFIVHLFLLKQEVISSVWFRRGVESERKVHEKVQIEIEIFALQSKVEALTGK